MNSNKDKTVSAAAHYAVYLGLFWVFKYIFLITSEYAGDLYLYIYNIMTIGTPVLFYGLTCVYRDKRLGGSINMGQVIKFAILLFFFASLLEMVIIAIHIMVIDPHFLINLQHQLYIKYENSGLFDKFLDVIKEGLNFGPITYLFSQIIANIISGIIISLIFGYLICKKRNNQSSNN